MCRNVLLLKPQIRRKIGRGRLFLGAESAAEAAGAGGGSWDRYSCLLVYFPARWVALKRKSSQSANVEMAEKSHDFLFLLVQGSECEIHHDWLKNQMSFH